MDDKLLLELKSRANAVAAALRAFVDLGHLDEAPEWLRAEVAAAAAALAMKFRGRTRGATVAKGERALERAHAWLQQSVDRPSV